jgi:two-component system, response regulator PdtaR
MTPASVFIVEDEAIVADDLRETLKGLGYTVTGTAKNAEIALEKIAETVPDIILMDIHIAGTMDGIDTAAKIHTLNNIPVVFLTAHADAVILERAKKTEPYGYIIKPYDERGLQSTIEMALYKFKADERVKDNEVLVRSLVNLNHEPVFILDKNTNVLYINDAFTSQKPALHPAQNPRTLEDLASSGMISGTLLKTIREHFNDASSFTFDEEFREKWISHTITPLHDQNDKITRCAVGSYDITEIKKRELDLTSLTQQLESEKQSLLLFSAMLDSMDDFVIATDMMGNIIYINRTFQERFGYTPAEISGRHISLVKDSDDLFALDTNAFFVDKKKVWAGRVTLVNKFGLRIRTLLKSTPVSLGQLNVCRVFVLREQLG